MRDQLVTLFASYDRILADAGVEPNRNGTALETARFFAMHGAALHEKGRTAKALKWLGFVQGVMCACGYFSNYEEVLAQVQLTIESQSSLASSQYLM